MSYENKNKPVRTGKKITVADYDELPEGRGATVQLGDGNELAVYKVHGKVYAIENFCPHRGAPLANSRLYEHVVECDWHGFRFDIRNGLCLTTDCPIESYQVEIEDDKIHIIV